MELNFFFFADLHGVKWQVDIQLVLLEQLQNAISTKRTYLTNPLNLPLGVVWYYV